MSDNYHKPGDVIRLTVRSGDTEITRSLLIYEHKPQSILLEPEVFGDEIKDNLKEVLSNNNSWNNDFYRYLDLDSGEVRIGYIASSASTYSIEKL